MPRQQIQQMPEGQNILWWRPVLSAQRSMNKTLRRLSPTFVPETFWEAEEAMFETMQENTHRVFSEFFNSGRMMMPWWNGSPALEPHIDIVEDEEAFTVKADLREVEEETLEIEIGDSALTIKGYLQETQEETRGEYIHRESAGGMFRRTVALPEEADIDKAEATLEDKALYIDIPKRPEAIRPVRKLEVKGQKKKK